MTATVRTASSVRSLSLRAAISPPLGGRRSVHLKALAWRAQRVLGILFWSLSRRCWGFGEPECAITGEDDD